MLASSGLNFGLKKSIPHILGIGFGFGVMVYEHTGGQRLQSVVNDQKQVSRFNHCMALFLVISVVMPIVDSIKFFFID